MREPHGTRNGVDGKHTAFLRRAAWVRVPVSGRTTPVWCKRRAHRFSKPEDQGSIPCAGFILFCKIKNMKSFLIWLNVPSREPFCQMELSPLTSPQLWGGLYGSTSDMAMDADSFHDPSFDRLKALENATTPEQVGSNHPYGTKSSQLATLGLALFVS